MAAGLAWRGYNRRMPEARASAAPAPAPRDDTLGRTFTRQGREFLRGQVPHGDNRGRVFTIAQPLAGRYRIERFFASGGMGLLLERIDLRTRAGVLLRSILHH